MYDIWKGLYRTDHLVVNNVGSLVIVRHFNVASVVHQVINGPCLLAR